MASVFFLGMRVLGPEDLSVLQAYEDRVRTHGHDHTFCPTEQGRLCSTNPPPSARSAALGFTSAPAAPGCRWGRDSGVPGLLGSKRFEALAGGTVAASAASVSRGLPKPALGGVDPPRRRGSPVGAIECRAQPRQP